jgi:hypothetical protein
LTATLTGVGIAVLTGVGLLIETGRLPLMMAPLFAAETLLIPAPKTRTAMSRTAATRMSRELRERAMMILPDEDVKSIDFCCRAELNGSACTHPARRSGRAHA